VPFARTTLEGIVQKTKHGLRLDLVSRHKTKELPESSGGAVSFQNADWSVQPAMVVLDQLNLRLKNRGVFERLA